ncbi:MAG: transposase [Candidatus Kariarchaeaceae archaeon]
MRRKLPAYIIFQRIGKKPIALISNLAKKSGWDQPLRGRRFFKASAMVRGVILYYIKRLGSLDALESYLRSTHQARRACGYGRYAPSRSTFSRFLRMLGSKPFEILFYDLVKHLGDLGMVTGRHLAIDSTHIRAWSKRKSKDKKDSDYKLAKNCDFARLGMTPKGFMPSYRVHVATVTKSEIPIAIKIFPGNIHDRKAFQLIFRRALRHVSAPLVISADKGFSSGKNRELVQAAGAACVIRPGKTDLKQVGLLPFIPIGMSEQTYWQLYWRRNAVERTFGQAKGHCGLKRPRVVDREPIKQHVFLSFICHHLLTLASAALGFTKTRFSLFV